MMLQRHLHNPLKYDGTTTTIVMAVGSSYMPSVGLRNGMKMGQNPRKLSMMAMAMAPIQNDTTERRDDDGTKTTTTTTTTKATP